MELTSLMKILTGRSFICKGKTLLSMDIHISANRTLDSKFYKTVDIFSYMYIYNCYRVNKIIQEQSNQSACTFIYLASPPNIDSPNWQEASRHYLELLTELTVDLPPTILVHGVHTVTSTTL